MTHHGCFCSFKFNKVNQKHMGSTDFGRENECRDLALSGHIIAPNVVQWEDHVSSGLGIRHFSI